MRHRRLGQRIEGAPASFAAIPQKPVRTAPADDLAPRAMRTTPSRDALDAARPQARPPDGCAAQPSSRPRPLPQPPSPAPPSPARAAPRSSARSPKARPQNPQASSNRSPIRARLNHINRYRYKSLNPADDCLGNDLSAQTERRLMFRAFAGGQDRARQA